MKFFLSGEWQEREVFIDVINPADALEFDSVAMATADAWKVHCRPPFAAPMTWPPCRGTKGL